MSFYLNSKLNLCQKTLDILIQVARMSAFDPNALECLAVIVEEGGFERAAVRLSITQSAVSQRLRSLEVQVGTVLIVRSRPLKPTAAGRLLLKHAMQMRLLRADLERDLKEMAPGAAGGGRDGERISIAINADSIATWALSALGGLAHEGLGLEIITDEQDFTIEWLREGQVLGCVTTPQAGAAQLQDGAAGGGHALRRGGRGRLCPRTLPRWSVAAQFSPGPVRGLQPQG
jgi:ArgP family transcriptional regulator